MLQFLKLSKRHSFIILYGTVVTLSHSLKRLSERLSLIINRCQHGHSDKQNYVHMHVKPPYSNLLKRAVNLTLLITLTLTINITQHLNLIPHKNNQKWAFVRK